MSFLPANAPPLRRRMAAWLYEGLLTASIIFIVSLVSVFPIEQMPATLKRYAMQAILFVVLGVYFSGFWSRGQTLAMKTWHIRIVDRTGQPPSKGRALLRYVLCGVWFLPPLAVTAPFKLPSGEMAVLTLGWIAVWALLSRFQRERQFWHDVWAGTRLIDTRPARPA
ncbi:MAG: RDD family protein [Burkholderiaceae bacterium]|jgi:uncharacterized RDD family membrane protein YckC|nr:RDD family protein [Burkholderiaceae bacterium]